ncbi:MAG: carbohydrate kinase family protein [Pseudomonadota bacterium]
MTGRSGIICAGNWIIDLVHDIEHWPAESDLVRIGQQTRSMGGGAANVVAALAKLETGLPLWPMGAVGDDEFGAFVRTQCQALGLPTSQLLAKAGVATAHTHVMSVAGRSRTFFYQGGANDALRFEDFPTGTFSTTQARIFYLGYLTLLAQLDAVDVSGMTDAARVLQRARKAGLITCVDLVSGQHPDFRRIVEIAAPHIDYLILNETEAARATGFDGSAESLADLLNNPATLRKMADLLIGKGIGQAVVVHCPKFALWVGADGSRHQADVTPLSKDQIVSHLGAGDAFGAGLLFALHEGWSQENALALGNMAAGASLKGITANSAIPPLSTLSNQ